MPGHSSMSIANEFLRLAGDAGLTQMQLQKLVYIAHGWNLAINGEPLVAEDIEAWDNGPVFRELWDHLTRFGSATITRLITPAQRRSFFGRRDDPSPYAADLTESERAVVESVWKRYGGFGAFTLSGLTHQAGTPWHKAYFGIGRNAMLDQDEIGRHYRDLAMAARA